MSDLKEKTEPLGFALVVIQPFGDYQRGDKITDTKAIDAILNSENVNDVHKVGA